MNKNILKKIFGSFTKAADALGVTKGSISSWPEELKHHHIDRVRGAAVRLGVYRPDLFPDFEANDASESNTSPQSINEGAHE